MSLRPIIILPDPRLRIVAKPVLAVDDSVRALMDDMLETMYDAPGIGLAAPQIGFDKRVIVLDVAKRQDDSVASEPMCFANPEILWLPRSSRSMRRAACRSPEYYEEVERPARVKVGYLDREAVRRLRPTTFWRPACNMKLTI